MIASGEELAKKHPELGAPLMYKWHDSYYLGGAHGMAGILLFLLKVRCFNLFLPVWKDKINNCLLWTMNSKLEM